MRYIVDTTGTTKCVTAAIAYSRTGSYRTCVSAHGVRVQFELAFDTDTHHGTNAAYTIAMDSSDMRLTKTKLDAVLAYFKEALDGRVVDSKEE